MRPSDPLMLFLLSVASVLGGAAAPSCAQSAASGPTVPIEQLKGKTGEYLAMLTQHHPLATAAEIAKRLSLPKPASPDASPAVETEDVFIPAAPAADETYGVLVAECFPGHQWPPKTWKPVLEKHHLIWIGVVAVDSGRPVVPPASQAGVVSAAAAPASDPNAAAGRALSMARNYVNAGRYDTARAKLGVIIQKYPGTPAATEAQALLDSIAGK